MGVEQGQFDAVLQNEQISNSSTTEEDTSSQTNSQGSTSQQEAFNQKYQPVEVLNRDGGWVRGYFVHRCIMVSNLEEVDRKWALYDEKEGKYAFMGQIRLPKDK